MDPRSTVITGYAFHLPGARSPAELADILLGGRTTTSEFPPERIDRATYFDAKAPTGVAKIYSMLGGCVPESESVDRWVLDTALRALDSAHLPRGALRGTLSPVFVAHSRGGGRALYDAALMAVAGDLLPYLAHCAHPSEYTRDELKQIAGQVNAALREGLCVRDAGERGVHRIPGAVAEALGTRGKVLVVDGNCTGGLIALELAARELQRGTPFAVAGGLSYVDTLNQVIYSNSRLLSPEGCHPFLDDCSGTVISDGVVMLVLTTLERAQRDGLPIHGVVRGVGGANDGAVERYMLTPNPRGHVTAIERAHRRAAVHASEVSVFFAHGSGTKAGDAVEGEVFDGYLKANRDAAGLPRVPVLSVKGNVGHAKEASGLANLVALLALFEAEAISPPVRAGAPRTAFDRHAHITVTDAARPWPADGSARIGGVSAIASGGQNYHAVIEGPSPALHSLVPRSTEPGRADGLAEPIAVVGIAASFAGASDVSSFWRNLVSGRSVFRRRTPASGALGPTDWSDSHPEIYADWGAPLDVELAAWLAHPERYAERPADILRYDPLHFLLVDLARTAAAGAAIECGSNIGVVVAADHCSEFGLRQVGAARLPEIERHLVRVMRATGRDAKEVTRTVRATMKRLADDLPDLWPSSLFNLSSSFLGARIARAFDLTGPTCAIEAGGAASSFAALDEACGRLAAREVDAVFWATADMRLGPLRYADECAQGALSRGARPTAFDAASDGYLPGEGATVCLLRTLSHAQRRGDRILGVIRAVGSAFAPPVTAQPLSSTAMSTAIRRAYDACDVSPDALGFVECFGSGQPASDQAEVVALKETLTSRTAPLRIGAVMPNVGHVGAAAGAASMFKTLLALSTGTLPATVGVTRPIVGERERLQVVARPQSTGGARYAGINATGPGGTHYHVVVEAGLDPIEVAS
jgi:acyl transferase domain-containing protein